MTVNASTSLDIHSYMQNACYSKNETDVNRLFRKPVHAQHTLHTFTWVNRSSHTHAEHLLKEKHATLEQEHVALKQERASLAKAGACVTFKQVQLQTHDSMITPTRRKTKCVDVRTTEVAS